VTGWKERFRDDLYYVSCGMLHRNGVTLLAYSNPVCVPALQKFRPSLLRFTVNVQFIGLSSATACSLLLDTVAKDFTSLIDGAWTLFNVLPLTREQVWKRRHDIQLSVDYFQAIYSSQASLLHRKPRHTLLSSLVHYSHDISTTTSLSTTPYNWYVFHVTGIVS